MPRNKNALIRYRIINRLLRNRKYVSPEEMMEACREVLDKDISKRTLDNDLSAMRYDRGLGYDAPIKYDHDRKAYYYEDPDYSIDRLPLNDEELSSLSAASVMLEQFEDIELFSEVRGAIEKIVSTMKIRGTRKDNMEIDFIEFEKIPVVRGREHLPKLIDAIDHKRVVEIEYQKFGSQYAMQYFVHPYLLKEYRGRWYLIGYNEYWDEVRVYGLDRINGIVAKHRKKYRESGISPKEYFENVIGITAFEDTDPVKIKLRFSPHQANYLMTQPLHPSQELEEKTKDHVDFSLTVKPNFELISSILGWGSDVEVLEPASLRDRIKNILKETFNKYKNKVPL